jgi:hypothetical protein
VLALINTETLTVEQVSAKSEDTNMITTMNGYAYAKIV